jgi:hypothetical protein
LASVKKKLQQVKMNNATLARYINAKRKEEAYKKAGGRGGKASFQ